MEFDKLRRYRILSVIHLLVCLLRVINASCFADLQIITFNYNLQIRIDVGYVPRTKGEKKPEASNYYVQSLSIIFNKRTDECLKRRSIDKQLKEFFKRFKRLLRREKGSVIIFFTLSKICYKGK